MPKYPEVIVRRNEFVTQNAQSVVGITMFHLRRYMINNKWQFPKLDAEISNFVKGTKDLTFDEVIEYAKDWVAIEE